ncbi:hypothetical protein B0H19DRAFT_1173119 [Mycena capillaripes]|nr:hypothetical protein B0H19DRAFT_1173119 [Mycena capillaripes]
MRIPQVVWALSVVFALGAAQSSSDSTSFPSSFPTGGLSTSTPPTMSGFPAESSSFAVPSAVGPFPSGSFESGLGFPFPSATPEPVASASPSSVLESAVPLPASESESTHFSKGPIIGAAVGGSIAASLVVLAGTLFCARLRTRNTLAPPVEGASDVTRRCEALEREVSMLREQLARLEARLPSGSGEGAAAILCTNEKDGLALDGKAVKDQPPTYLD